jgi:transposase-like protein
MGNHREVYEAVKEEIFRQAVEKVLGEIALMGENPGIKRLFEETINQIMKTERQIYLKGSPGNKGNGYYPRTLSEGSFKLDISVPRDRQGNFRPYILPQPYHRVGASYTDVLYSLIINGYSPSQLQRTLSELGLPYTQEEIKKIVEELRERLEDFKTRQLPSEVFAIFIDGYHTDIKQSKKVRKACVYTVLGMDLLGQKDIYGFYEFFGSESKDGWLRVLNDLLDRGLQKVVLVVSDDFPGLSEALEALYPQTEHQLCFVHLKRNIRRNMGKVASREFLKVLHQIKQFSANFDEAVERFNALCDRYQRSYPYFMKELKAKAEKYFNFLRYPDEIRKYIYTTNSAENFNRRIEEIRMRLGGYFQSVEILEMNLFLQRERLLQGRWRHPVPILKANAYELRQIFNRKFYGQTQDS